MDKWQEIYKNNIKLDNIFIEKYSSDKYLYEKNCIGLLVELGEFINETKCFKYWSIKKPDKEKMLEEYADCITSSMVFLDHHELKDLPTPYQTDNILELLNHIFRKATELYNNNDIELAKDILSNIFQIRVLLNIDEQDLINACKNKQKIILDRLNSNY